MSCAKIDPALHKTQKPPWIKVRLPSNPVFFSTKALISDLQLRTVCESAQCQNRWECWSQGTATFMIAGDRCTRACGFCAVTTAKPFALENDEPKRVAEAVRRMNLKHVVITAVARDDLKDGGADHFARTITAIREMDPSMIIEVLVPDFHAQDWCIQMVLNARPDIYNHNMETVERLTPVVRSRAMTNLTNGAQLRERSRYWRRALGSITPPRCPSPSSHTDGGGRCGGRRVTGGAEVLGGGPAVQARPGGHGAESVTRRPRQRARSDER